MSKNLNQVPTAATSILATDKMYIARSPFGVTDDRYILGSDILTQLASPLTTKGDLYGFSTVDARLAVGSTNGQMLQVNSGAATGLSWSTPTYPSASGSVGKIMRSDGTNNVYSTATYPDTVAVSTILYGSGANVVGALATANNGLMVTSATGVPSILAGSGTTGNFLQSNAAAAPSWSASTLILDGNLTTSGAFASTFTMTGITTVTFPTTGTLATTSQIPSVTPSALTKTDDTNVTMTLGGTPATALLQATSMTLGWSGQLSLARGGTNANLTASAGGIFYSTGSAGAILSGTTTANQVLLSGSSAAPSWSTATYPGTTTVNQILYSSAANTISEITTGNNGVLITSAGGVPSISSTLPAAVQGNITAVGTITSGTWNGSLISLVYGGTNANLTASNGGIVWSNATQMQILSGTATAGQMLRSGSTATPSWSTTTWPATSTANNLLYSSFNNTIAELASANSSVLVTSAGGVPSLSTTIPANISMTTPLITTGIKDANGATVIGLTPNASAVNYVQIGNAATTAYPSMTAAGSDANIYLSLLGKGTSGISIFGDTNLISSIAGNTISRFIATASAVNYFTTYNNVTGSPPALYADGSDTNIGIALSTKGTGTFTLNGFSGSTNLATFTSATSAVNYLQFANAATGGGGKIFTQGSDSSVQLVLGIKNAGIYVYDHTATIPGRIRLATASNASYTGLKASASSSAVDFVLPPADGLAGQQIVTDASANLSFGGALNTAKNMIIGGDFGTNPWQRGTSFTAPAQGTYTADRFTLLNVGTSAVVNVLQSADAPTASQAGVYTSSCLTYDITTADGSIAAGDLYALWYKFEGYDVAKCGFGQSGTRYVTLSFWHKHTVTGTWSGSLWNSAQNRCYPFEYTQDVTDTWEKATITVAVDTSGTWLYTTGIGLQLSLCVACGSTYAGTANAWVGTSNIFGTTNQVNGLSSTANFAKFALMQLEFGNVANSFQIENEQQVLAKCQRYYYRQSGVAYYGTVAQFNTTSQCYAYVPFPTSMRVSSTAMDNPAASKFTINYANTTNVATVIASSSLSINSALILITGTGTPFTVGHGGSFYGNAADSYLGFTAEL
jgi:hypothetical protein